MQIECTSTGSLTLDVATGEFSLAMVGRLSCPSRHVDHAGGGYPKGRVIEIYGPESSGKTTLALHAIAEVQKRGGESDVPGLRAHSPAQLSTPVPPGFAAFIDAEHALDPTYASKLGVDTDQLLVSQPDCGEMALDIVDQLVRSQAVDIVVIDSVAALVPRAELEGDMGDTQMGLQARLMSKALRKITGSLAKSQCTVLFLNQLRSKIGVFFGNPEVTSGGNALKYFSSMRLDVRRKEILKDESGIHCKVKVVKNKVAPPFRSVELDILFGRGIDQEGCLLDAAERVEVLERKGAWYSYQGANVAQGRAKMVELIRQDEALRLTLEAQVRERLNPTEFLDVAVDDEEIEMALPPVAAAAAGGAVGSEAFMKAPAPAMQEARL
jgi:recombination protein RecA